MLVQASIAASYVLACRKSGEAQHVHSRGPVDAGCSPTTLAVAVLLGAAVERSVWGIEPGRGVRKGCVEEEPLGKDVAGHAIAATLAVKRHHNGRQPLERQGASQRRVGRDNELSFLGGQDEETAFW